MDIRPKPWWKALINVVIVALFTGLLAEVALRLHNPIYVPLRSDKIDLPVNRTFTQRNTANPKVDDFRPTAITASACGVLICPQSRKNS